MTLTSGLLGLLRRPMKLRNLHALLPCGLCHLLIPGMA